MASSSALEAASSFILIQIPVILIQIPVIQRIIPVIFLQGISSEVPAALRLLMPKVSKKLTSAR
jgi:hypothetical protein